MKPCHRFCLIALILVVLASSASRVGAQSADTIGVYYFGSEDAVARAIDRADPYLVRVNQTDLAQVIVVNNPLLNEATWQALETFGAEVQQGRLGMVIFCGPLFPQDPQDLRDILGVSTFGMDQTGALSQVRPAADDDPLQRAITWNSAPDLGARTVLTNPNLLRPVVTTSGASNVVQRVRGREAGRTTTQTQTLVVGAWFDHPTNAEWEQWAYFDYLIYRLIADAAGVSPVPAFADYPRSPTPQLRGRLMLAGAGVGLLFGALLLYTTARRRLYLNTELAESWRRISTLSPGLDALPAWRRAGFHRPLAGFLAFALWSLILFIPLLIYTLHLLPDRLAMGTAGLSMWEEVMRWTMALWILLDAGTGVAVVRHFSAYFDRNPQRAVQFLQFYVWWHVLSGAVQVGLTCLVTAVALPTVGLAHLTYPVLARALLQLPGLFSVFTLAFRARQRFGTEQFLNLLAVATAPIFQTVLILMLRAWVSTESSTMAGVAVVFGLAGGTALAQGLAFLAGAYLHRREGQAISALFLPTFDNRTVSEALRFGIPWAIGAAIPALAALLQTRWATTTFGAAFVPANMDRGSWQLLILIAAGFEILLTSLFNDLMPALTEAATLQTQSLLRYYVSQAARYGAWFSAFLLAALAALGNSMLPEALAQRYGQAWTWLVPMLVWGALRWTVWLPDKMLEAAGRPGIIVRLAITEMVVRLGAAFLLTPRWGAAGLIAGYVAGLLVRAGFGVKAATRHLVRARFYLWQSLLVPALAALPICFGLHSIQAWRLTSAGRAGMPGTIVLLVLSIPVYAFLTAVLGGWDKGSVSDLRQAVDISGAGYPLAWLVFQAVRLGAHVSLLHGRHPVGLHGLAEEEALAVTAVRERD